jgi:S-adenosylmethionine:tRNA-ribosyltransferase-isomerase (queuine synthetase)
LEVAADGLQDRAFIDISQIAKPGDLFIFNDTKVIPARLYGQKETGGQVELLIERITGENRAWVQIRASKTPKVGSRIHIQNKLGEQIDARILERKDRFYEIAFGQNVRIAFMKLHSGKTYWNYSIVLANSPSHTTLSTKPIAMMPSATKRFWQVTPAQ